MIDDDPKIDHEVGVHAGEPQPAWCDQCLRQAAFMVQILTVDTEGVSLVGEVVGCPECRSGCFAEDTED